METGFDAATAVGDAITNLGTQFATVAPIAIGVALAAFGVKWLLGKGKSIAK